MEWGTRPWPPGGFGDGGGRGLGRGFGQGFGQDRTPPLSRSASLVRAGAVLWRSAHEAAEDVLSAGAESNVDALRRRRHGACASRMTQTPPPATSPSQPNPNPNSSPRPKRLSHS